MTLQMNKPQYGPPLITLPHPLTTAGRAFYAAAFLRGETLGAYVERNGIVLPRSEFHVQHNGRYVPMHLWQRLIPRTGDQIVIHAIAQGGGGGGKVLRTVAMIALVVMTYGAGSWAGLGASLANATGLSVAAAQGLMLIGGGILITPLLPEIK